MDRFIAEDLAARNVSFFLVLRCFYRDFLTFQSNKLVNNSQLQIVVLSSYTSSDPE